MFYPLKQKGNIKDFSHEALKSKFIFVILNEFQIMFATDLILS